MLLGIPPLVERLSEASWTHQEHCAMHNISRLLESHGEYAELSREICATHD